MDVLLVRAGALGDMLLLRRVRRRTAHGRPPRPPRRARAPAPSSSGRAWGGRRCCCRGTRRRLAALLAGTPAARGPVAEASPSADVVVAWTRSEDVARALARVARRLLTHDPAPPPGPSCRVLRGCRHDTADGATRTGHASLWLARALEPLGLEAAADPPLLVLHRAEHDRGRPPRRRPAAGVPRDPPGSGSTAKNWPAERFLDFARRWTAGPRGESSRRPSFSRSDRPRPSAASPPRRRRRRARVAAARARSGTRARGPLRRQRLRREPPGRRRRRADARPLRPDRSGGLGRPSGRASAACAPPAARSTALRVDDVARAARALREPRRR